MVDFDALKNSAGEFAEKAKDVATDDRIDTVADKLKAVAPDSVDSVINTIAEKAKGFNN